MKKILYQLQSIKNSFWFLPLGILLLGIISAIVFIKIDLAYEFKPEGTLRVIFSNSTDSAKNVLSLIAGGMIGVAGTVFSITLVVLTLASSQFGPRLLNNFMYKKINQVVLGVYIATYAYCLIIINSLNDGESYNFIPHLAILFALILTVIDLVLLIIYIHQISISIKPSRIIDDLKHNLENSLSEILEKRGDSSESVDQEKIEETKSKYKFSCDILCNHDGYLQFIDFEKLLKIAHEKDLFIEVLKKPGKYLIEKMPVAKAYYNDDTLDFEEDIKLINSLEFDSKKTLFQDAEFGIHQIVEIAVKALSPGINDPFTAIVCIDNLTSVLCYVAQREFKSNLKKDKEGTVRLQTQIVDFKGIVASACDQIRQFGANSPSVIIRQLESLITVKRFVKCKEHLQAIDMQALMIYETGKKAFLINNDLKDLEERYDQYRNEEINF